MPDPPAAATAPRLRTAVWLPAAALLAAAVALSLLLPAFQQNRRSGFNPVGNNAKQLGLGVHNFHSTYKAFPPRVGDDANLSVGGPGNLAPSWQTALLPFLDERELWAKYDGSKRYDDRANAAAVGTVVESFLAPHDDQALPRSESGFGLSHWAGNVRVLGDDGVRSFSDLHDGTAETLLLGEVGAFPKPWADPSNLRDAAAGLGSSPRQFGRQYEGHLGGVFVMADGSTQFLSDEIDPAVFAALGTPDGGESVFDE